MMNAIEVDPKKLQPSNNPRRKPITPERINEIARSMADPAIGVIEALVVRDLKGKGVNGYTHQVIAGDTRRLAAIEAKLERVPCVVKELDDLAILKLQLIENVQRNDMHFLDEGEGLATLVASKRETIDTLAKTFGKSRRWIYQRIEFTKLTPAVKKLLVSDDRFTASHAERLVRLNEQQQAAAVKGDDGGLFVYAQGSGERIAASVDELDDWITDQALDVTRPQTLELFPEVAEAQRSAEAVGLSAALVSEEPRSTDKTVLGRNDYRSATGKESCKFAQPAVIVKGATPGTRTSVCINRACPKHWALSTATSSRTLTTPTAAEDKKEEARIARERERAKAARDRQDRKYEAAARRAAAWAPVARAVRLLVLEGARKTKVLPPAALQAIAPRAMPSGTKAKKLGINPARDFARAVLVAHLVNESIEASYNEDALRELAKAFKVDVKGIEQAAAAAAAKKGAKS